LLFQRHLQVIQKLLLAYCSKISGTLKITKVIVCRLPCHILSLTFDHGGYMEGTGLPNPSYIRIKPEKKWSWDYNCKNKEKEG
jgi:hypothetical protein